MQHPNSPSTPPSTATAPRKIGIAVNLSDEGAYTIIWAVKHYLRQGDTVVLLHVCTTTHDHTTTTANNHHIDEMKKIKNYFHMYTISRVNDFAEPLRQAQIPYNVHIVMDREIKERLCSEICGINLSALIIGSRGSVGDYCELYCVCPVVVARYSDGKDVEEDVVSTANSVVGNFSVNSVAEDSTANSVAEMFTGDFVMAPPKATYVEEIDEIMRLKNEGLLSRGDLNELMDRAYDQILEEELMGDSDEELLMSLLENERRQQSHTSTRRKRAKRAKHRHT
ncbi:universal stress protein PHOS32-like [Vicia villosa]|uniref:universal stress protein PHOS32-like n=1 Tax=Vicia villosa TaxID=3911 RepID=UPI00273B500B|nr:universal stress protein PHOS32-like [Vicia villosa]